MSTRKPDAYAERLGIPPPDLVEVVSALDVNLSQLLGLALLERGGPMSLEEVAARLASLGVESRVGDLGLSLLKAWRGQPPVLRDEAGRFGLDLTPTWELFRLLSMLGHQEAARRFGPPFGLREAPEPFRGLRVIVRPLFDRRGRLRALAGAEAEDGAEPWVLDDEALLAEARLRIEPVEHLVGVELRKTLGALGLDPDARRLTELQPPQKTRRLNRAGRLLKITLDLLLRGSTGISKPLESDERLLELVQAGQPSKLRRRLAADVGGLLAGYRYGAAQGFLRLRWGFIDDLLPVAWSHAGDLRLYDVLLRAEANQETVELVIGSAPSRSAPWSRVAIGRVVQLSGHGLKLVRPDGVTEHVSRAAIQAARLVDADGREVARAGPIRRAASGRDLTHPPLAPEAQLDVAEPADPLAEGNAESPVRPDARKLAEPLGEGGARARFEVGELAVGEGSSLARAQVSQLAKPLTEGRSLPQHGVSEPEGALAGEADLEVGEPTDPRADEEGELAGEGATSAMDARADEEGRPAGEGAAWVTELEVGGLKGGGRPATSLSAVPSALPSSLALALALAPSGRLRLVAGAPRGELASAGPARPGAGASSAGSFLEPSVARALVEAFRVGEAEGLFALVQHPAAAASDPTLGFGLQIAQDVLRAVCLVPEADATAEAVREARPEEGVLQVRLEGAPPMRGGERLDAEVLAHLYGRLAGFLAGRMDEKGLAEVLSDLGGEWRARGRVWLHLAENDEDEERPFAFLATFTAQGAAEGRVRHTPLSQAFKLYEKDRGLLLSLLAPVERAAQKSPWFRSLLESRQLYEPLAWSSEDAHRFLKESESLEGTGIMIRLPKKWRTGKRPRPTVQVRVGEVGGGLHAGALLSFDVRMTLGEGEPLTEEESRRLLEGVPRLELLRGSWVDVDPGALRKTLDAWSSASLEDAVSVADGLRLIAGLEEDASESLQYSRVEAGAWLKGVLGRLREPGFSDPSPSLKVALRPYQREGLSWLATLCELGVGGCLADDMGLGKTVQVIALLLHLKERGPSGAGSPSSTRGNEQGNGQGNEVGAQPRLRKRASKNRHAQEGLRAGASDSHPAPPPGASDTRLGPSLLVLPASLIGNWKAELSRFAPSLRVGVLHRSEHDALSLRAVLDALDELDVVITTYGTLGRHPELTERSWPLVVLDEAQNIKNPGTAQAKRVRSLEARARVALTGTPIENRLGDLWSLFGFLNPGLLGSKSEFTRMVRRLAPPDGPGYGPLRRLLKPYLLRRLKTDRRIIQDLPDKTEVTTYCALSKTQAALYADSVDALERALATAKKTQRRGVVLAFLTRFKQICNHPSHWLQDGVWAPSDSGKMGQLIALAETVRDRQEKVLVFTQYKEMTDPLSTLLTSVFGEPGLVLHGGVPVKARAELVARFQSVEGPPFFVLSLKAGGSGLNLTAASHVVHFDRWWNPAVESQATDRAFRIGQHRNVLVHRFVCPGTLEARIDDLIEKKRALSTEILSEDGAVALTELSDAELLDIVRLDRKKALEAAG